MKVLISVFLCLFVFNAPALATLIDNHDGTITEVRNDGSMLMWLQDANYAFTSGYDSVGLVNWDQAMQWADTLKHAGYEDWRLPTTIPATTGSTYPQDYLNQEKAKWVICSTLS